jgi:hypothetical protein
MDKKTDKVRQLKRWTDKQLTSSSAVPTEDISSGSSSSFTSETSTLTSMTSSSLAVRHVSLHKPGTAATKYVQFCNNKTHTYES